MRHFLRKAVALSGKRYCVEGGKRTARLWGSGDAISGGQNGPLSSQIKAIVGIDE
jgi:hypothetical protein